MTDETSMSPEMEDPNESLGQITEEVVKSGMIRDKPDIEKSREALVTKWQEKIDSAKSHWKEDFDRMKENQAFLRGAQWDGEEDEDKYMANVIQRHINQRVAALYAKNPKVVTRRRKTLDFKEWDGSVDSLNTLQAAVQNSMMSGMPIDPQITNLLTDIQNGVNRKKMMQKVSDTLQIVYDYTLNQQLPPFKIQMKQLVRRVCTTGIGYVKLGYTRIMERSPDDVERMNGMSEQISKLEALMADKNDGEIEADSYKLEELRGMLEDYKTRDKEITREGITFDFPSSTSVIIDPACRHLRTFLGARWIAEEFILSVDDVKEIYGVDLKNAADVTNYETGIPNLKQKIESLNGGLRKREVEGVCVWVIYDKGAGQTMTIADGYSDFLVAPKEPDVFIERFWPIFPLTFNEAEDEESIFPRSDVHLLKPLQMEYNRCREGLRQHRIASRPKTAVAAGQLDEDDMEKLQSHPANAVIVLNSLPPNGDVNKLLQPINGPRIDTALYDTGPIFEDLLRVVGQSDASIGAAQSGVTATGDSIAEQNRTVALASNSDDLDDMLIELSRSAGQILLAEMDQQTVFKIVGPGAVWPELSKKEIADELILEIEAGSSGRPNRAAEVANMERLTPLLLQIPGVRPDWLVKQLISRLDDQLDVAEAFAANLPSIIAQNAMQKQAQIMGAGMAPGPGSEGGADNQAAPPQGPAPQGAPSQMPQTMANQ
jgi:hypothetical protein